MKNRNGSALLVTLGILAALMLVAGSLLSLTCTECFISSHSARDVQTWYIAESGLEKARSMLANDPDTIVNGNLEFDMPIVSGKIQGSTHVTLIPPELNDRLIVRSAAELSGGGKRILEAAFTAPPWYVVYCKTLRLNKPVDIMGVMNGYGIQVPPSVDVPDDLTGSLVVDSCSSGAYQYFENDSTYFLKHTHRYHAPAPDIGFYRKLNRFRDDIDWHGYSYVFQEGPLIQPGGMSGAICVSAGDLVVYSTDGELVLDNVLLVAGRDIWVINLGTEPTAIRGQLLAGRHINLYQLNQNMNLHGALLAGKNVDLYNAHGAIELAHDPDANDWPSVLRGKTGSLQLNSIKEAY